VALGEPGSECRERAGYPGPVTVTALPTTELRRVVGAVPLRRRRADASFRSWLPRTACRRSIATLGPSLPRSFW